MRRFMIFATLVPVLGACQVVAQQPDHTLLPTSSVAREIAALQGPGSDAPTDPASLRARVARVRKTFGAFIIRQIAAYPSISAEDLEKRLGLAFGDPLKSWVAGPRVFAVPAGPKTASRIFVVTYSWFGFYGKGGSETILESYMWERGVGAHLGAGLVPPFFSGYITEQEQVCWFANPDTYWLLVSGQVGGASGRALGGTTAVFEIGPEHVKTIWTAPPGIGNVLAYAPHSGVPRWEVEYVDMKKFYGDLPHARLLDVFQVDYDKRTFQRVIHQPLE
jgi:hypothetical protein